MDMVALNADHGGCQVFRRKLGAGFGVRFVTFIFCSSCVLGDEILY